MYDEQFGGVTRELRRKQLWAEIRSMDNKDDVASILKRHANFDAAMAGDISMFALQEGDVARRQERNYVLPFGSMYKRWNPRHVEDAPFGREWLGNMQALICRRLDQERTRPTRLIFTSGLPFAESDRIGVRFIARHDQTNKKLGDYGIAGVVVYDPWGYVGRIIGNVPNVAFACSTYK